jgi:RED-like protein N-terminal region
MSFKTAVARAVYNAVFNPPKRDVSAMFLPRRTAFMYDLEVGAVSDIPTTVHRSAADCPQVRPRRAVLRCALLRLRPMCWCNFRHCSAWWLRRRPT